MYARIWVPAVTIATMLFGSSTVLAQQSSELLRRPLAELQLSNETLQLRYLSRGEQMGSDRSRIGGTFFLSEERDIVLSTDLMFPAQWDIERFSILFGPRVYAALLEDENNDVMSVAVGAEMRLMLHREMGLALSGQAFHAPDILTFGSADKLTDLSARIELAVAPRVVVFGGMRWFEFDLVDNQGERTLQEELFVGFGYRL